MTMDRSIAVLVTILAAAFFSGGGAVAQGPQQPDETLPGFKANVAYASSAIDNVSLHNGDPGVVIPLGPEYPLSAGATWQMKAYYSVKFWDIGSGGCQAGPNGEHLPGRVTFLHGRPSLGLG